ncbi:GNAT superfamily N-acetyltransferase [Endobacter medicaginis]|uniref:GNAT family N-acetyltransferase n=2 Tax=Endobacter medicaginis TaxID=1181271 RepID=A0A850NMA7_9PROT|nr:GNAT family N-acetyltransferase [Endobacter medicaginis]MBB3174813.1 GNAT superfamily N-acetyltransferase [Endobacter medicaginis]MCX5476012.1 GNAT family N-acetyltransferase [Endobacter medicaginis]NVN30054.1 GNAT family N-acetyltransferase [Endobacter medicaginis]
MRHARRSEGRTARTYVVCAGSRVVGYYALASGVILRDAATARLQRNAPDPIPIMLLGRLAVDRDWLGRGIARGMLKDALLRTLAASEIAGIAALVTHALSDEARRFYEHHGFAPSPLHPRTLMVTMREALTATL